MSNGLEIGRSEFTTQLHRLCVFAHVTQSHMYFSMNDNNERRQISRQRNYY